MSKAEEQFAQQLDLVGIKYVREHMFHPDRRWRLDFIFPEAPKRTAVEIEGITRFGRNKDGSMRLGRHQTHKGIKADMEKYNSAAMMGWLVLRVTQDQVRSGEALQLLETALGKRNFHLDVYGEVWCDMVWRG